jgi:glycine cleavage system protein P-like pyridoxal-binding family
VKGREGKQTLITIILILVVAHGLALALDGASASLCGLVVVVVAAAAAGVLHHAFGLLEEIHCCWFGICNSSFRMCI